MSSQGDNKCKACGQWAGPGHSCPATANIPTPASMPRVGAVKKSSGDQALSPSLRQQRDDRVSRAKAHLAQTGTLPSTSRPTPANLRPPTPNPATVHQSARPSQSSAQRAGNKGYGNAGKEGTVFEPQTLAKIAGWDERSEGYIRYSMHEHAAKKAAENGWNLKDVLKAAQDPYTTYDNGRYEGQKRHIRGDIVAIVDVEEQRIVTCYANIRETAWRKDQSDPDALRYKQKQSSR